MTAKAAAAVAAPAPGGRCALTHAEQKCRRQRVPLTVNVPLTTTAPVVAYGWKPVFNALEDSAYMYGWKRIS